MVELGFVREKGLVDMERRRFEDDLDRCAGKWARTWSVVSLCTTYPRHGWGGWNSVGQSDQGWCKAYHVSVSITAAFFFFAAGRTILAVSEVKDADKFERPWFGSLGRVSKPAPTCGHDLGATSTYLPPKIPMVPLTPQPSVHPVTASGQPRHHQKAPQTDAGHLIRRPAAPRLIFGPGTLQPRNARLITAIYSPPRPLCTEADRVSLSGDWPSARLPHQESCQWPSASLPCRVFCTGSGVVCTAPRQSRFPFSSCRVFPAHVSASRG